MACDSHWKKRRGWNKVRIQVLIFKAVLGVLLSWFLVEKVSKPVLSEVKFDGENGTSRETPNGKEVPHLQEGGCAH